MEIEKSIVALEKIPVGILDLNNEEKWDLTEAIGVAIDALRDSAKRQQAGTIITKFCPIMGETCIGEQCAWWRKNCRDCAVPLGFGAVTDIATR